MVLFQVKDLRKVEHSHRYAKDYAQRGREASQGTPVPGNADNSSNHWVVIVGSGQGTDMNGNAQFYFEYYDNNERGNSNQVPGRFFLIYRTDENGNGTIVLMNVQNTGHTTLTQNAYVTSIKIVEGVNSEIE